jgi:hypothetical protein
LVDCAANRRANLIDGATFDDDGTVIGASWQPLDTDDPLRLAVCVPE